MQRLLHHLMNVSNLCLLQGKAYLAVYVVYQQITATVVFYLCRLKIVID